eukprot:210730-Rhodomonas_salina.1
MMRVCVCLFDASNTRAKEKNYKISHAMNPSPDLAVVHDTAHVFVEDVVDLLLLAPPRRLLDGIPRGVDRRVRPQIPEPRILTCRSAFQAKELQMMGQMAR